MGFDLHGQAPMGSLDNPNNASFEEEAQSGVYFRNNVWYWRPLWEYVAYVCDDILTLRDYKSGQYNDGYVINAEKSMLIGSRLRETIKDYDKTVKAIGEIGDNYEFSKLNVEEFANFCLNSGGFDIY
jgi:hypothetical protein